MPRAAVRFVVAFAVLALAAGAGNWQLDQMRKHGRATATHTADELRLAEQGLSDYRGAQAGYLATGQSSEPWLAKATALALQMNNALANLSTTSLTVAARPHYDAATQALAALTKLDERARGFVAAGQPFVAADVLFMEGNDPATRMAAALAEARAAELADFEATAGRLGLISTAGNGGVLLLGVLLMVLAIRAATPDAAAPAGDGQLSVNEAPERSSAAAPVAEVGLSSPAWSAPEFDLTSAAELCVDLGRLVDGRDLPGLMARAATVLEAKGLVLWVSDAAGMALRPSVAHGYSEKVLQRIGSLPTDGDNVTSLAYRTRQPQVVRGSIDGHGALAVPLVTGQGCVGVLAAEVQGAKPGDARFAVARIIAAQLSTLVSPAAGASSPPSTAPSTAAQA
jgi:CHASE3 domain sensor protein